MTAKKVLLIAIATIVVGVPASALYLVSTLFMSAWIGGSYAVIVTTSIFLGFGVLMLAIIYNEKKQKQRTKMRTEK